MGQHQLGRLADHDALAYDCADYVYGQVLGRAADGISGPLPHAYCAPGVVGYVSHP